MAKWEFGPKIKFVFLEKAVRKTIERFVARVIGKDESREALRGIYTDGNVVCATNGFAMAMAKLPNPLPDEVQGLNFFELHGPVAMVDPIGANYPDLKKVIRGNADATVMRFAMDPRLLRDILEIFRDCRTVSFQIADKRSPVEIMGSDENGIEVWAWVMPMYSGDEFVRPEWIRNINFTAHTESTPAQDGGEHDNS